MHFRRKLMLLACLVLALPLVIAACDGEGDGTPTTEPFQTPVIPGGTTPESPGSVTTPSPSTGSPTPSPGSPTPLPQASPTPIVTPEPSPALPGTPTPGTGDMATPASPATSETGGGAPVSAVMLEPAGESGEQAIAALRGQDDETEITVGLLSALMGGEGSGDYEASVIEGTCETPGGVAHAIGAFSGGLASGSVNEQVDSLLSQELAIAVHEPGSPDSVVACGNMSDATELDGGEPFPTPASGGGV